ncbi:MAG: xylulokinase [Anaerolineales bacterium]|nr:xylulokinase [Anaerolineales bacterium]
MQHFIGIDSSTTATKALLMREDGAVLAVASSEYSFEVPYPLWSEQSPELWWNATIISIQSVIKKSGVDPREIKGIGLTGQMHGLVILDKDGNVLRPSILWNDQRTQKQCDDIRSMVGFERLIQITGNNALTGFTAPKILWVKQEEPEIYSKIAHILLPKDYVRYKLTGEFAMDKAGGSGTILFDLKSRDWSDDLINDLGISREWLPKTFEGSEVTGIVSPEAAGLTGLIAGTPVMGGGGDQAAAAVGTGAVTEGVVSMSLGTSGVVFATMDVPSIEPEGRLHAFCHSVTGKWHLMGVMLSAAGSLRWQRDTFAPGKDFGEFVAEAKDIKPGSEGLLFLPYLTGERTPYPDPLARGAFVGLTVSHTLPHLTRSVLEGVSFGLRDSFELMKGIGLSSVDQVRVTGGGAKSPLWRQILADVFNAEIVTVSSEEGAAYGAAILAATGAGIFQNVPSACDQLIHIQEKVQPGKNVGIYQEYYQLYNDLYPALNPSFSHIASIELR